MAREEGFLYADEGAKVGVCPNCGSTNLAYYYWEYEFIDDESDKHSPPSDSWCDRLGYCEDCGIDFREEYQMQFTGYGYIEPKMGE